MTMMMKVERENGRSDVVCSTCSCSSSIGINSDEEEEEGDEEIQSKLKETNIFDSSIADLEQALPIRRGISNFYDGKSKSFASLGDDICSSVKEITKPENAYTRKRKNIFASSVLYDKPVAKRKMTLGLAVVTGHYNNNIVSDVGLERSGGRLMITRGSSLYRSSWRSFSGVELHHCGVKSNLGYGKRTKTDIM